VGGNLIDLDAVLCGLIGVNPEKVPYIPPGERAFGRYDRRHIREAERASGEWFPTIT